MSVKRDIKSFDFILLILVSILCIYGIILLGSLAASSGEDYQRFYDKQKLFFIVGLVLLVATACIDYNFICKFYVVIYVFNIILLLSVFVIGSESNVGAGVSRWIKVGPLSLQPSEISKVCMIIFISQYVDKKMEVISKFTEILKLLLIVAIPLVIILKQPSLSASLVTLVILGSILFVAKVDYRYFLTIAVIAVPLYSGLVYDLTYNDSKVVNVLTEHNILRNYHLERFVIFTEKNENEDKYQQTYNSLNAIGSGGVYGKGLTKGSVNKSGYIPNNENDFIIALLGEELGFIGSVAAIFIMFLIISKCLLNAQKCSSNLGRLIIAGVAGMFLFQVFVNVAVATDLMPNTGMSFPFLGYGGSSMFANMIAIGLVINVSMERPKSIFEG